MFATIYSEDFVTISASKENKIILLTWKGVCSSKEYRQTMEHALEIAVDFNYEGWISDTSEGMAISPEDTEWVSNYFIPKALSQIKKVAVVLGEDIFRNIAAESLEGMLQSKLKKVAYFHSFDTAQIWITKNEPELVY